MGGDSTGSSPRWRRCPGASPTASSGWVPEAIGPAAGASPAREGDPAEEEADGPRRLREIDAVEQQHQVGGVDLHGGHRGPREVKDAPLQALVPEAEARAIPEEDLHAIAAALELRAGQPAERKTLRTRERAIEEQAERAYQTLVTHWRPQRPKRGTGATKAARR